MGVIILWQDPTYITVGYNTTATYNYTTSTAVSTTYPVETGFPFEWSLYLTYISFFIVASMMLALGKDLAEDSQR